MSAANEASASNAEFDGWKLPTPPAYRLCTLSWTCSAWPDGGRGVWEIIGYEGIGTRQERFLLRRVMPAEPGGSTGEQIKVWRDQYDLGGMQVWRKDLADPAYCVPSNVELTGAAHRNAKPE